MSKRRLQVVMADEEFEAIRSDARRHGVTVSEWVRSALRRARHGSSDKDAARKLASVRAAGRHNFPTGDIGQMLEEIERGYSGT